MAAVLQMSWQPKLLNQKRRNGPPLGLRNLGNSCYLNSVLQCLTYTPPLANFCLSSLHSSSCDSAAEQGKKSNCPFCILEKRIARSLSVDLTLDTPIKLNSCLRIFADHFRQGRQEDAHEFLRYVIDACHNTCIRLKKLQQQNKWRKGENGSRDEDFGGDTVVKDIFGGSLQSQVKCLSCGLESNKVDEIMDISLDILRSSSLEESMQKFFQAEILDGNNKYKCDKCKQLVRARKQMSLLQAPNILVIQLKRFEGIFGGKIDRAISFKEVLVLSSYMSKLSQDPYPKYNLFGTIVHSGFSPDSGHYYAYIKDAMSRWYCCNDSSVKLSNLQEVLSEKVYILFFSRTKQRPVPTKAALTSNGDKSQECNGRDASKTEKVIHSALPKAAININGIKSQDCIRSDASGSQNVDDSVNGAYEKLVADSNFEKSNLTTSIVNKVPALPQADVGSNGNHCNNLVPGTKINFVLHKSQCNGKNGNLRPSNFNENGDKKPSNSLENGHKNMSSSSDNAVSDCDVIKAVDCDSSRSFSSENGNGKGKSSPPNLTEERMSSGSRSNGVTVEWGHNKNELQNGGNDHSGIAGSKRKLQDNDSCTMIAEDSQLLEKLDLYKQDLGKEASSVLRSCGWADEVYHSMLSRKKLCTQAGSMVMEYNDLKKKLISDAKQKFISQIPMSLKEKLVESIRGFLQER